MKFLLAGVVALFAWSMLALSGCAERSVRRDEPQGQLSVKLQQEQARASRVTSDPVGLTKSLIKISDILLTFTHRAASEGESATMRAKLSEYLETVARGRKAMMESGRDPRKKPDGFMHLEIALRRQLRELNDVKMAVGFEDQPPVEAAIATVTGTQTEILNAVMGTANDKPGNDKPKTR